MRTMAICAAILTMTVVLAIAQRGPAPAASKTPARATAQPRLTDAQIESEIKARFAKSKIDTNHFAVRVQGGVATLEGKTDIVQHKGTATRLAKSGGAIAVNNRIQVSEAGKKKASENLTEGRRRAQVKRGE